ncbi:hypothetical protein OEA41_002628 [Lepraria neglecta]|uniref:Uncharacterized protein n=1 Tax=Lepraria neglecta TaxID=209136 RepID=A0AAE0DHK1_9LECA|nr:hypothetical protein OEA41_002628 [Lepraria neglecta]
MSEKNVMYDELRASEEALLPNDKFHVPLQLAPYSQSRRIIKGISRRLDRAHSKINYRLAILQVLLIAIYTVVFIVLQSQILEIDNGALIPSPARPAIQMERRTLHNSVNASNPYKGPPSPELDLAWHNLLRHGNIRLSAQELREMGKTSVELADDSGDYIGALGMSQQAPPVADNWDALDGWASQRAFDIYDPKMLRHPTLGTSFPPGWDEQQETEN